MNAAGFLIALVLGFVGGVAGALVTIEIKTDHIRKEIDDAILGISHINSQVKTLKEADNALAVAIQELTWSVKRDRGAIWQSLNGLWNDYDERHKPEGEPEAETGEEPKEDPIEEEPKKKPEEPDKKERKKPKK